MSFTAARETTGLSRAAISALAARWRANGTVGLAVALATLAHLAIWSLGAWLVVDSLHVDTLEILGWANEWALVYPKHPPLATWIAALANAAPGPGLPAMLIVSQGLVAISAAYVWATARLYAPAESAGLATIGFLLSPLASVFAIQYNHNLVLAPFELASLFYGLRFLERRRTRDALALGVAAGLAFLAKYEAALVFLTLIGLTLLIPRFRDVWLDWRVAMAAALFFALVGPHLAADWAQGWPTLAYAGEARRLHSGADVLESFNQLFDGLLYAAIALALTTAVFWGTAREAAGGSGRPRFGAYLAATPTLLLVALSFATLQIIRQGWLLPMVPFAAIGLALALQGRLRVAPDAWPKIARRTILVSLLQLLALALFLFARDFRDKPIASYAFDSSELSEKIEAIWAERGAGALACLAAPGRSMAQSPLIQLDPKPRFVDLADAEAAGRRPCAGTGGLAVVPAGSPLAAPLTDLERRDVSVTSEAHLGSRAWRFDVFVIPPQR